MERVQVLLVIKHLLEALHALVVNLAKPLVSRDRLWGHNHTFGLGHTLSAGEAGLSIGHANEVRSFALVLLAGVRLLLNLLEGRQGHE